MTADSSPTPRERTLIVSAPRTVAPPPVALTIAGSDSGGGAGLQADLRTFSVFGVLGACAVTALTAQNTLGVRACEPVGPDFVEQQLDAVLDDLPVRAVKTGMLATPQIVELLVERADDLPQLVVDPVLVSTTGHSLGGPGTDSALWALLSRALVVTPNLAEAATLLGHPVQTLDQAVDAAHELAATGARWVVVTGGHLDGDAVDVVVHGGRVELLGAPRVRTGNDHGTGCTFAAAVVASLAHGDSVRAALLVAKRYVHENLAAAAGWSLGRGAGPLAWEPLSGQP
ncbi:MAG: hydroxymethylpyrimidine/phosphomethylpyrimidine kinase [Actinomycetota bacterium]|nr:hydroxymethylpyrimidine/phosphomethylpyrimidine kinase [Actinomycetota bacterium]